MREEFDVLSRTLRLQELQEKRDYWINLGWLKISELFEIPALTTTTQFDSVASQDTYVFPYDYNGTEAYLYFKNRRLDYGTMELFGLKYERRTGLRGGVYYYTYNGTIGTDLAVISSATFTNGSATVATTTANAELDNPHWIRIDPNVDQTTGEPVRDSYGNLVDPGEWGYQISEGGYTAGVSFTLTKPYRGPTGTFPFRVRPAESLTFTTFGTPSSSIANDFKLVYYRKPARLYNAADVPEWPSMELAIVYMALATALEFFRNFQEATIYWQRAMQRVETLKRRKDRNESLSTEITVGSVVGRPIGPIGVNTRAGYGLGNM